MSEKYYITTAIAYTSGKPHIGNTYEIVLADSIARYKRMLGYDVFFQTGTDEHGQKIEDKAKAAGVEPQQFVDQVAGQIKEIWDLMNTSYDKFMRTTDPEHERQVQKIFKKLYDQGDIYKSEYEGWYCKPCESFFTESQIADGKCPDCGAPVEKAKEEAYFFRMSKYADRLLKHIEENPQFIQPESRKNEMINNFIKPGLQDLCVSRTSFTWGVPVDFDPKHVVYVWIDALTNYITGLGFDCDGNHGEKFKRYWPADVHLIGKDILRFHTIYWPIMLMALDLPLPKQVFGHPWLLVGEGKMSKSKGNVIYADDLVRYFGVDAVRYIMLHEMPFAQDGTVTYELMIERINSDLANILGNLVNRTLSMTNKYFGGLVRKTQVSDPVDEELIALAKATPANVQKKMDELRVADAMDEIFALLRRSNKYIDETMPWVLGKDESKRARLATVIYNLCEVLRIISILLTPFMPSTTPKIQEQIGAKNQELSYDTADKWGTLPADAVVTKGETLFPRIDVDAEIEELNKLIPNPAALKQKEETKKEEKPKGIATFDEITFEDFSKIELRVGKILDCEPVKKSKKLLKLTVNDGEKERTVVSGISQWYQPDDLIGHHIILVANLKPAKLCGVESQGMILAADCDENTVKVIFVDDMPAGSGIH